MTEGDQKSKDEAFGLVAGPNTPGRAQDCVDCLVRLV